VYAILFLNTAVFSALTLPLTLRLLDAGKLGAAESILPQVWAALLQVAVPILLSLTTLYVVAKTPILN